MNSRLKKILKNDYFKVLGIHFILYAIFCLLSTVSRFLPVILQKKYLITDDIVYYFVSCLNILFSSLYMMYLTGKFLIWFYGILFYLSLMLIYYPTFYIESFENFDMNHFITIICLNLIIFVIFTISLEKVLWRFLKKISKDKKYEINVSNEELEIVNDDLYLINENFAIKWFKKIFNNSFFKVLGLHLILFAILYIIIPTVNNDKFIIWYYPIKYFGFFTSVLSLIGMIYISDNFFIWFFWMIFYFLSIYLYIFYLYTIFSEGSILNTQILGFIGICIFIFLIEFGIWLLIKIVKFIKKRIYKLEVNKTEILEIKSK